VGRRLVAALVLVVVLVLVVLPRQRVEQQQPEQQPEQQRQQPTRRRRSVLAGTRRSGRRGLRLLRGQAELLAEELPLHVPAGPGDGEPHHEHDRLLGAVVGVPQGVEGRMMLAPPSAVSHSSIRLAYFSARNALRNATAATSTMPSSTLVAGLFRADQNFAPITAPVAKPTTNVANRKTSVTSTHASSAAPSPTSTAVHPVWPKASAMRYPMAKPDARSARFTDRMP
jgi:hypothetical protein